MLGVEEEFHVVDLTSRRAAPEVDRLLDRLGGATEVGELSTDGLLLTHPVVGGGRYDKAIGLSDIEARSSVRLGFGRYTTEEELLGAIERIDAAAREQRFAA